MHCRFPALSFFITLAFTVTLLVFINLEKVQNHYFNQQKEPQPFDDQDIVKHPLGLKPIERRSDIGNLLEELKFKTGGEVGVQEGNNAFDILSRWKSCESFSLIDLWANQENYEDLANVSNERQEIIFNKAKKKLDKFQNITKFMRMSSLEAAKLLRDNSLDFVYIDARHDYCGAKEDINAYWSKVRPGGIMSGHDYVYANKVRKPQDWSTCQDGSKHPGAVRGAVEEFAIEHGLTVTIAYKEVNWWSWMIQKQH